MTQLRILAAGSRDHRDYDLIYSTLAGVLAEITTIGMPVLIHGGQVSRDRTTRERYGADYLAAKAWREISDSLPVPLELIEVPADWTGPCDPATCRTGDRRPGRGGGDYCPAAGPRRNQRMIDEFRPTIGVAFPLGESRGTRDMIERLEDARIPVRVVEPGAQQRPQLRVVKGSA